MIVYSTSHIAVPPGETIREQIEDRQMTPAEFAARLSMSPRQLDSLLNGETELTGGLAGRLEAVTGVPADFWVRLEGIYREALDAVHAENTREQRAAGG